MRARKYNYEKVLQGNYCGQWEDLIAVDCDSYYVPLDRKEGQEFRNNCKAYRENENYPHRVIRRRTKTA